MVAQIIILILLLLAVLYALSMMGRTSHEKLPQLRQWHYAHRGLHGDGIPENSMAAFKLALWKGYGIELDVHLLKDGGLAVIHDSALIRTTGAEGKVEDLTVADLEKYHLEGTFQTIPTFREVLELFDGKAPMIIELKAEGGNQDALAEAVCKELEGYEGLYCIESFDPRCLLWLKNNRPDIVRGQLSCNFVKGKPQGMPLYLQIVLANVMMNFLTRPDFVAYDFSGRKDVAPVLCKYLWKLQPVSWTLRSKEDFDTAVAEEQIAIFEGFEP
jgi:glycerophosphoryl diester phosphodiesterase